MLCECEVWRHDQRVGTFDQNRTGFWKAGLSKLEQVLVPKCFKKICPDAEVVLCHLAESVEDRSHAFLNMSWQLMDASQDELGEGHFRGLWHRWGWLLHVCKLVAHGAAELRFVANWQIFGRLLLCGNVVLPLVLCWVHSRHLFKDLLDTILWQLVYRFLY